MRRDIGITLNTSSITQIEEGMKKSFSTLLLAAFVLMLSWSNFAQDKRASASINDQKMDQVARTVGFAKSFTEAYLGVDFEDATFPPTGWTIAYTGTTNYWSRVATASGYGVGTACAKFAFYSASTGTTQSLVTPGFAASVAGDSIKFDHAYATYTGGENDQLKLEYSTDAGTTWTQLVLLNGGASGELVTAAGQSGAFLPTATQWKSKSFALPVGTNKLRFTAISAWGNNLYIDNIKLGTPPANDVGVYAVTVPTYTAPGTIAIKANVKNFGSASQPSFTVKAVVTPGSFTSTKTVTNLDPNATVEVTFDNWTATVGDYDVKVYTQLAGDANPANDTTTKHTTISTVFWTSLTASPAAVSRSSAAYVVKGGKGYIYQVGGGASPATMAVSQYDVTADTWSTGLAAAPIQFSTSSSIAVGDSCIYVFGGDSSSTGVGKTVKYNYYTNTWTQLADMLVPVTDVLACKSGTNVYIIGGGAGTFTSGGIVYNNVQLYNTLTNTYTACTPLPYSLAMAAGGLVGNKIFISGGWNGNAAIDSSLIGTIGSDPTQITWAYSTKKYPAGTICRTASYPVATGTADAGIVFTGGSIGGATPTNLTYYYKFATDAFTTLPTLPVARSNFKAAGNGTDIFFAVAGYNGTAGVGNLDKLNLSTSTNPTLTVVTPNGGESWNIGSQQTIKWASTLVTSAKIEYSTNNGTSWTTIAASVPVEEKSARTSSATSRTAEKSVKGVTSYVWTVPNTASTSCLVKVSANNVVISDVSDAVFTIKTAPVSNIKFEDKFNGLNTPEGLALNGWKFVNYDGGGTTTTFNGNAVDVFAAFEGPDTGYVGQNFNGANGLYIDQWLISKQIAVAAGDSLTFWWRSTDVATTNYPDSVEVRWSPTGDTALASFTQIWGKYRVPNGPWVQWKNTFPQAGTIRFALRYIIYNGGSAGANSDYWGLDWVQVVGAGTPPPPTGWEANLVVKDATTGTNTLTFGQKQGATNGIDAALGEQSLPPAPPSGVFDTRFNLPVTPADASLKDFRVDTLKQITWNLSFQPGTGGYPFTFTWTPASLPAGSFTLKDAVTGTVYNVDMKAQSSLTVSNTGITTLQIVYQNAASGAINLASGWNIISAPVTASDMTTATLFPAATSPVYGYSNGYSVATSLAVDKGYWVRYPQAATVNLSGSAPASNTVPLVAGWNLIGPHMTSVAVSGLTTTPSGILTSPFYGYNNGYATPTNLEPGKGYWIRTSAAGTLNLAATAEKSIAVSQNIQKDWGKITIADKNGASAVLYAAKGSVNLASFDLPPVPPTGVFDARFSTGRSAEALGADFKEISLNGAAYPVTISVDGMTLIVRDKATTGRLLNQVVKGSVTITDPSITSIEVSNNTLPSSYQLFQNYPNPFNPTTTIKFALPEKANVSLTVYNQLGQKVAVLINGQLEAGYHEQIFNASQMASGIYFYEIRTDKFTSVKKLVLMK
ncbi:MAG: choice-of-anchor J domain-containing protein [Ignavibacteria bacterium]|nr:choice-of-anchor J domain-containing protein [Ignavibacteria bacterium]